MGYEEDLKYYLTFSRRELQVLCRNNRLPANRSHAELADILASYYEKKNHVSSQSKKKTDSLVTDIKLKDSEYFLIQNSRDSNEVHGRTQFEFKSKEGDTRRHFSTRNTMTNRGHMECQTSENTFMPEQSDCYPSTTGNGETFNELKKYSELRKQRRLALNHAFSKNDNLDPNAMPRGDKSSKQVISTRETPSFEFFVSSEDGIELHVDLDSSPAEWVNNLKDDVHTNLKKQNAKPNSFPNQTGSSSLEANTHMKISQFENVEIVFDTNRVDRNSDCTNSTLSSESENNQSMAAKLDATIVSSDLSIPTSSGVIINPLINLKHTASVLTFSIAPISDVGKPSIDEPTNQEQMACPAHNDMNTVETNGLCNSVTSFSKENNPLKTDLIGRTVSISCLGNLGKTDDVCKVSSDKDHVVVSLEGTTTEHNGPSNFCEALSTATSVDCIPENHECSIKISVAKYCKLGKSTKSEEKANSECSQSQKSSENNSKRSYSPEPDQDIESKRRNSNENNSGVIVNLRSTRTSAKETAIHPRRSSRLLEVDDQRTKY